MFKSAIAFVCLLASIAFAEQQRLFEYEKRYRDFKQTEPKVKFNSNVCGPGANSFDGVFMSSSGKYLSANVHGDITKEALKDDLSYDCLNLVIESNVAQDDGEEEGIDTNHFDNDIVCESYNVVVERMRAIDKEKDKKKQLKLFGQVLHAVQDFYSHSNFLELKLSLDDGLLPGALPIFDFETYCPSRKMLINGNKVFTAYYQGEHSFSNIGASAEDFANPQSHLHWNKDLSPKEDPRMARWFSRSSLKRSKNGKGPEYFDYAFRLQVQDTKNFYLKVKSSIKGFDKSCRL